MDHKGLLTKGDLKTLIESGDLVIEPLLQDSQIGEISIDLRIGTDFLTSQLGRDPYLDTSMDGEQKPPLKSFFNETRRNIGESFLFHPSQVVLFSTLEYIKLPKNVIAILSTRSSYSRLGLSTSTIIQPGYCGCISVEVNYSGNTPIKVVTGARLVQARFYRLEGETEYFNGPRKYICQVRPIASKANEDKDLAVLDRIARDNFE
ncbi:MAG: dCTP deaminase [bacterium]|nr:dCTP deaminase [bacterium]